MDTHPRETLIHELDAARSKLNAVLEKLSQDYEIYPTWTIKHLLAHLAGWDEACIEAIESFLGQTEPSTPAARGIDFYNTQSVETRQELDYDHIRREYEVTREELKATIRRIPDDRFEEKFVVPWGPSMDVTRMVRVFIHHEHEHAEEIEGLIAKAEQAKDASASASPTPADEKSG